MRLEDQFSFPSYDDIETRSFYHGPAKTSVFLGNPDTEGDYGLFTSHFGGKVHEILETTGDAEYLNSPESEDDIIADRPWQAYWLGDMVFDTEATLQELNESYEILVERADKAQEFADYVKNSVEDFDVE